MAGFSLLIVFVFGIWGLSYIICQSWMGWHARVWFGTRIPIARLFLYCPYCVSFWLGPPLAALLGVRDIPLVLASSFVGTGVALLGAVLRVYPSENSFAAESELLEGIHATEKEEHV